MMIAKLVLTAALVGAALVGVKPASARCYSRWHYPWPQHCSGAVTRIAWRAPEDRRWYVQIAPPKPEPQPARPPVAGPPPQAPVVGPPTEIDPERAMALEALKAMLAK